MILKLFWLQFEGDVFFSMCNGVELHTPFAYTAENNTC